jgi:hypothetical protein
MANRGKRPPNPNPPDARNIAFSYDDQYTAPPIKSVAILLGYDERIFGSSQRAIL